MPVRSINLLFTLHYITLALIYVCAVNLFVLSLMLFSLMNLIKATTGTRQLLSVLYVLCNIVFCYRAMHYSA